MRVTRSTRSGSAAPSAAAETVSSGGVSSSSAAVSGGTSGSGNSNSTAKSAPGTPATPVEDAMSLVGQRRRSSRQQAASATPMSTRRSTRVSSSGNTSPSTVLSGVSSRRRSTAYSKSGSRRKSLAAEEEEEEENVASGSGEEDGLDDAASTKSPTVPTGRRRRGEATTETTEDSGPARPTRSSRRQQSLSLVIPPPSTRRSSRQSTRTATPVSASAESDSEIDGKNEEEEEEEPETQVDSLDGEEPLQVNEAVFKQDHDIGMVEEEQKEDKDKPPLEIVVAVEDPMDIVGSDVEDNSEPEDEEDPASNVVSGRSSPILGTADGSAGVSASATVADEAAEESGDDGSASDDDDDESVVNTQKPATTGSAESAPRVNGGGAISSRGGNVSHVPVPVQTDVDIYARLTIRRQTTEVGDREQATPSVAQGMTRRILNIPICQVHVDPTYERRIAPNFVQPRALIHTPLRLTGTGDVLFSDTFEPLVDYVADAEDSKFLTSLTLPSGVNAPSLSELESLICLFERLTATARDPVQQSVAVRYVEELQWDSSRLQYVFPAVYRHWYNRRLALNKPLIRRFWPATPVSDTSHYLVFRQRDRERYRLRRQYRRNDNDLLKKLQSLRRGLGAAEAILRLIWERESLALATFQTERAHHRQRISELLSPEASAESPVPYVPVCRHLWAAEDTPATVAEDRTTAVADELPAVVKLPPSEDVIATLEELAPSYRRLATNKPVSSSTSKPVSISTTATGTSAERTERRKTKRRGGPDGGDDSVEGDPSAILSTSLLSALPYALPFAYSGYTRPSLFDAAPSAPVPPALAAAAAIATASDEETEGTPSKETPSKDTSSEDPASVSTGPATLPTFTPSWSTFLAALPRGEPYTFSSPAAYLEALELDEMRGPDGTPTGFLKPPDRHILRCRVGRSGRLFMDRLPVYSDVESEEETELGRPLLGSARGPQKRTRSSRVIIHPVSLRPAFRTRAAGSATNVAIPPKVSRLTTSTDAPSAIASIPFEPPATEAPPSTTLPSLPTSNQRLYAGLRRSGRLMPSAANAWASSFPCLAAPLPPLAPPSRLPLPTDRAARLAAILAESDSEDDHVSIPVNTLGTDVDRAANLKALSATAELYLSKVVMYA